MNSENISKIRNKLEFLFNNQEVIDVILFGSVIKGKILPNDIDVAIILYNSPTKELKSKLEKLEEFHISILTAKEFFCNSPLLINTLLREGYSLKNKKLLSENFKFSSYILFIYNLSSLSPSIKVKVVNALRGKNKTPGLVVKNHGEWLANQVFVVPIFIDKLFEEFFSNLKVKYKKKHILMH